MQGRTPLRPISLAAFVLTGCSTLTAPPAPDPITSDTTTTGAATATAGTPQAKGSAAPGRPAPSAPPAGGPTVESLQQTDLVVGKGKEAKAGDHVFVHYTGKLSDGTKFDSSLDRNKPFDFNLGKGDVIKGWDQGVPGMKVGGKRKLVIPSSLGYGDRGMPPRIPPKATLVFEVELLDVK